MKLRTWSGTYTSWKNFIPCVIGWCRFIFDLITDSYFHKNIMSTGYELAVMTVNPASKNKTKLVLKSDIAKVASMCHYYSRIQTSLLKADLRRGEFVEVLVYFHHEPIWRLRVVDRVSSLKAG